VSELVSIKIKDLDFLTMQLHVVGKGGKIREVPLRPEVVEVAKEYMNTERREHKSAESAYLLLTQRAGKLDRDTVNKLLKKHGEYLGITMWPHKFRHTFCTRLLKVGVPLTTVSKLAGHSSIQTTSTFYINTSRQDKIEAVDLL
jgi:site-specific recombinase XerD